MAEKRKHSLPIFDVSGDDSSSASPHCQLKRRVPQALAVGVVRDRSIGDRATDMRVDSESYVKGVLCCTPVFVHECESVYTTVAFASG